jgi:hypothetical protein
LKFIQLCEEYERLFQKVQFKLLSALTLAERVEFIPLIPCSGSDKKIAAEFGMSQYIVRKGRALQEICGIHPGFKKKKVWPLSDAVLQSSNFMRTMNTVTRVVARGLQVCGTAT